MSVRLALLIVCVLPGFAQAQRYHFLTGERHRYHVHGTHSASRSTSAGFVRYTETTDFDVELEVTEVSDSDALLMVRSGNLRRTYSPNMTGASMLVVPETQAYIFPNGHVRLVKILQDIPASDTRQRWSRRSVSNYDAVLSSFRYVIPEVPEVDSVRDGFHQRRFDTTVVGLDSTFSKMDCSVIVDSNQQAGWELVYHDTVHYTKESTDVESEWDMVFGGVDGFPKTLECHTTGHRDGISSERRVHVTSQ